MTKIDRWLLRLTLPVIAAALAWQAWIAPSSVDLTPAADPTPRPATHRLGSPDPSADPLAGREIPAAANTRFVPWALLRSYEHKAGLAALPETVRSLDGQQVTMAGFLLPLTEFEDMHEFALVGNHWSCCFGMPPMLNGLVRVRLDAGADGLSNTSDPLRVVGTFRTREAMVDGAVVSIYEIEDASASLL